MKQYRERNPHVAKKIEKEAKETKIESPRIVRKNFQKVKIVRKSYHEIEVLKRDMILEKI